MLTHLTVATVHDVADKADAATAALDQNRDQTRDPVTGAVTDDFDALIRVDQLPAVRALNEAVAGLTTPQRQELAAVMWLGRGDGVETWDEAVRTAFGRRDVEPSYITDKSPVLGRYLRDGLAKIGQ